MVVKLLPVYQSLEDSDGELKNTVRIVNKMHEDVNEHIAKIAELETEIKEVLKFGPIKELRWAGQIEQTFFMAKRAFKGYDGIIEEFVEAVKNEKVGRRAEPKK